MGTVGTALLLVNLCGVSNLQRGVVVNSAAHKVGALMAARFRVELAQTVIERATVWIEASTAAEAERLALKETMLADWRFKEAYGDIEVIGIQQITTEQT